MAAGDDLPGLLLRGGEVELGIGEGVADDLHDDPGGLLCELLAADFEAATKARREPRFLPTAPLK